MFLVTEYPRGLAYEIEFPIGCEFVRRSVLLSLDKNHFVLLVKINHSCRQ